MSKKFVYLIIVGIIAVIGITAYWYNFNKDKMTNQNNTAYESSRTSQEIQNTTDNNTKNEENTIKTENNNSSETENHEEEKPKKDEIIPSTKETEIASFTTKIYTKDSNRQNNVSKACSALNNTTVNNGDTFSFSKTVGKATTSKGYKKADVFRNGKVIEALGGGLCQVSTTLYNAVLKIPNTKVTERHSHSNKVPYIKSGKDAAVSYGTYDFKFINNTGSTLKIKATNTTNNITIKINKIG